MVKRILLGIILSLFVATNGWATYTGSLDGSATLYGTGSWENASLSWNVSVSNDIWTYNYIFSVPEKGISHLIFEVSSTFGESNIYAGTTGGYDLGSYGKSGNPGILGSIYGLKWDLGIETTSASITIVTDRAPMWGDFYAKDGVEMVDGVKTNIFAYNTQFGSDTLASIGNGNAGGWVLVPDTHSGSAPVPEPGTMLLFGFGLIGLAGVGGRRLRKR